MHKQNNNQREQTHKTKDEQHYWSHVKLKMSNTADPM